MSVKRDFYEEYGEMIDQNVDDEIYNICVDLYGNGKPNEFSQEMYKDLKESDTFRDIVKNRILEDMSNERPNLQKRRI